MIQNQGFILGIWLQAFVCCCFASGTRSWILWGNRRGWWCKYRVKEMTAWDLLLSLTVSMSEPKPALAGGLRAGGSRGLAASPRPKIWPSRLGTSGSHGENPAPTFRVGKECDCCSPFTSQLKEKCVSSALPYPEPCSGGDLGKWSSNWAMWTHKFGNLNWLKTAEDSPTVLGIFIYLFFLTLFIVSFLLWLYFPW